MITLVLFIALLATAMGQSVVMTILPSLGRETGMSELQVASILSSSALIYALGSTQWSKFAESHGNRKTLLIGLTGYSVGTFGFASVFWLGLNLWITGPLVFILLLIARMAQSTVMSATPPAAIAYVAAYTRKHNLPPIALMGRVTSANNLGQIFGPGFAGLLVGFGLVTPLFAIILLTFLALLLVWRKLPEQARDDTETSDQVIRQSPVHGLPTTPLILFAILIFLCMAMLQQSLVFLLIDAFHYGIVEAAQKAGMGMTLSALAAFAIQWTVVQRSRLSLKMSLICSALFMTCGYLAITEADALNVIYLGMAGVGCGVGIGYPTVTAAATYHCPPTKRAKVTGLITASPAVGYVIGPPIGAILYNLDVHSPFALCAVLSAVLMLIPFYIHSQSTVLRP